MRVLFPNSFFFLGDGIMEDFVGFGALGESLVWLEKQNYARPFVVASAAGWERFMAGKRPFFSTRSPVVFSDFAPNPDFRDIQKGVAAFEAANPDVIIALGGGSPIDTAKVIKAVMFTKETYDPTQPSGLKPSGDGPPVVAVATTAGSGAEATQFAIFYTGETKQSIAHPSLRPDVAVVDPELTYSVSPHQTAATGFDALSHAVESFWSSSTTPEAQELSEKAIGYALHNLYNAVHSPSPANRYNMAMAAYLAGKAINITRTTLPHALAYHLTKRYGLSHGHAVALSVPYAFLINMDKKLPVNMPGGREQVDDSMRRLISLLGQKTADDCFVFWRNLMHHSGLASTYSEIGIQTTEQVEALIDSVDPERMQNHPVMVTKEYLIDLLASHP